ncbi:ATP-binding cassette domain-containing protein [Rhodobacteraceae bacterium F11138]|nr:ATP-binding cassette domain-containing protein [Rhodobacteraceae bacterium F11138]
MSEPLFEIRDLKLHFPIYGGLLRHQIGSVKAVDGVSFDIFKGETLGLVGESGCGKSSCGRGLLRLSEPSSGEVVFDGRQVTALSHKEMRAIRTRMQMVFQDPQASLNPRMTVSEIISEPLNEHANLKRRALIARVCELMDAVGLNRAFLNRYPSSFSGGQRQRIGIARALALNPDFIVCDEPIAALDVSIQAQVVNLLKDLQEQFSLTYLFISHDLSMVRHIADRVAVMYLGKIVELADTELLYQRPSHPYSKALLSAVPGAVASRRADAPREVLKGDLPSPANPPKGCNFCTRCPHVMDICRTTEPELKAVAPGQYSACHLND